MANRYPFKHGRSQAGFGLLEIMVALVVSMLALAGMVSLLSSTVGTSARTIEHERRERSVSWQPAVMSWANRALCSEKSNGVRKPRLPSAKETTGGIARAKSPEPRAACRRRRGRSRGRRSPRAPPS